MGFLSTFFGGGNTSYADTVSPSIDRRDVLYVVPQDARQYLSSYTRTAIASKAEWARQNFGIVQEWASGIARHSVGRGIAAQFNTPSIEWNKAAERAVEHFMLSPAACDLSGRRNGYEQQIWMVEQLVILGECFTAYVENEAFPSPVAGLGACPCFFNIAASDVKNPPSSPSNLAIHDGIEVSPRGVAIRYHARSFGQSEFTTYDANSVAHLFHAHGAHQSRGVSPLAASINNLVDIHELKRLETRSAKAQRLIALVIKGAKGKKGRGITGALERTTTNGTGNGSTGSVDADTSMMEDIFGGAGAAIARLGGEGNVELLSSNTPSPLTNQYITDLLLRDGSATLGVPLEFFWGSTKLSGADVRGVMVKADATFQQIADKIIYRFFEPLVVRFLQWRIASGLLAEPPGGINGDWRDQISYRRPRRVTVDSGRDSAARIDALQNGLDNLRGLYDEEGKDWLTETEQWINEWNVFKRLCTERGMSEAETSRLMDRWRPAVPGSIAAQAQTDATDQGGSAPSDAEDIAALGERMNTYGIGVRAGAITPQEDDEAAFRAALAIPPPGSAVSAAWTKDEGTRRPITLTQSGGAPAPIQQQPIEP